MVPEVALLGFVNTWLMVPPDPALPPTIPPVIVPIVHVKVEPATVEANVIFGLIALQIASVFGFVTEGVGFTVIVIVVAVPAQPPVVEVGVIKY
jgi:hypothetical protein